MGLIWHGVNGYPAFVVEDQHDDLKKIAGTVRPDEEETVGQVVIAEVVDKELVFDAMDECRYRRIRACGPQRESPQIAIVIRMTSRTVGPERHGQRLL